MNREDIIAMAREAQMPFYWCTGEILYLERLERFAALVAAAEREACAKTCEELWFWNEDDPGSSAAKAIRARGETK